MSNSHTERLWMQLGRQLISKLPILTVDKWQLLFTLFGQEFSLWIINLWNTADSFVPKERAARFTEGCCFHLEIPLELKMCTRLPQNILTPEQLQWSSLKQTTFIMKTTMQWNITLRCNPEGLSPPPPHMASQKALYEIIVYSSWARITENKMNEIQFN